MAAPLNYFTILNSICISELQNLVNKSGLTGLVCCGGLRYLTLEGTYILTCMDETKLKSHTTT